MSDFTRYYATDIFHDKTGALQVKSKWVQFNAPTTNGTVIAAVTGKAIRVLSITAHVDTATFTKCYLKDGSGGSYLISWGFNTTSDTIIFPHEVAGWCETTAGTGLYADITNIAGATWYVSVRYIEVTY